MLEKLLKEFSANYGDNIEVKAYFAPGRVNLIGEHTDYNGGWVLPAALNLGTYLLCRKTKYSSFKFISANFDEKARFSIEIITQKQKPGWVNYPLGVINQLIDKGLKPCGMEFYFYGDIPGGAGLSSSASIEMVTAVALNDLFKLGLNKVELALLSQKAENRFVEVNCGIMDQFASAMGVKDAAILLNCQNLDYEIVPFITADYKLIIANTNKTRKLSDSKYNERRSECEKAVAYISCQKPIKQLCELDMDSFNSLKEYIPEEIIKKRAKHVVTENQRVIEAVKVLKQQNILAFGQFMYASHESLRYDYEVTGVELDTLVDEAKKIDGVIGSRMTGAGFGGCTISLVHKDRIEEFCEVVGRNYKEKTGLTASFYIAEIGEGVGLMMNDK